VGCVGARGACAPPIPKLGALAAPMTMPKPLPLAKPTSMPPPMPAKMAPGPPAAAAPAVGSSAASGPPAAARGDAGQRPTGDEEFADLGESGELVDYTRLPAELDARLEALDVEGAVRPTKILIKELWRRCSQKALLGAPVASELTPEAQEREKKKAFDLLDALSRSGSLPIDCCALHVLVAVTHSFADSLVDTVVVNNVNPIEKLERTALIVSETVQAQSASDLVRPDVYDRVAMFAAAELLPPRD